MFSRRSFLAATAGSLAASAVRAADTRKKIAFLGTVVQNLSHAQHFLDRHTLGYTWQGEWVAPRIDVASVFIDQFPNQGDLGKQRIERYKLKQFPTIAEALT